MSAAEFIDSNVLVYAYDPTDPIKQRIGQGLVTGALTGHICISTQVLAEFAAILLHKVSPRASAADVKEILDTLAPIRVIVPDAEVVRRAVQAHSEYGVHLYDGMIIAAAERAGCSRIWSEDFNHGQKYFGLIVENPFRC